MARIKAIAANPSAKADTLKLRFSICSSCDDQHPTHFQLPRTQQQHQTQTTSRSLFKRTQGLLDNPFRCRVFHIGELKSQMKI